MHKECLPFLLLLLSLFILTSCSDSTTTESTEIHQLNVAAEPSEAGTVTPTGGQFDDGETVEISASANQNWVFEKWQGGHNGTANPASITMSSDKQITALFLNIEYALNKEVRGEGSIFERVLPAKTTSHQPGTIVEVLATPDEGWMFSQWETDLTGSANPATLTMDSEKTVTAVFERKNYELTIEIEGEGAVAEEIIQAKTTQYPYETLVELTATPATSWQFDRWEGDLTGTTNPAQIEITNSKAVRAVFIRQTFSITTQVEGDGTVSRELISGTESETGYEYESQVQLTATPSLGWEFTGWQGDITSVDNPVVVEVNSDKQVTATFQRIEYLLAVNTEGKGSVGIELLSGEATENGYYYGAEVQLTAEPAADWIFTNWAGGVQSEENPLTITIQENRSITAVFARDEYTLDITVDGDAQVTTELLSGEQTATGYKFGSEVQVTITPVDGWNFVYWNGDISGTDNPIQLTMNQNYTATAILDQSPFAGGNGTETYPYQISNVDQLQSIKDYTDRHFLQINHIDAIETENWNAGDGFLPIGDTIIKFKGSYDGDNYWISNLTINRPGDSYVSLFGDTDGAIIKNVSLVNVDIHGSQMSGALVGHQFRGEILNSSSTGAISGSARIGGLVGLSQGAIIDNSFSIVEIVGENILGGLVGEVQPGGLIIRSYASGNVSGNERLGGLIGKADTDIQKTFSTGSVTGSKYVGGLVGENINSGSIIDSYTYSPVEGIEIVGGLVGLNQGDAIIKSSYSSNSVFGSIETGGLVGLNGNLIEMSYWNTELSNQSEAVGRGSNDGATGLNTTQMTGSTAETNMPEFDWVNIWTTTGGYPILRWQIE